MATQPACQGFVARVTECTRQPLAWRRWLGRLAGGERVRGTAPHMDLVWTCGGAAGNSASPLCLSVWHKHYCSHTHTQLTTLCIGNRKTTTTKKDFDSFSIVFVLFWREGHQNKRLKRTRDNVFRNVRFSVSVLDYRYIYTAYMCKYDIYFCVSIEAIQTPGLCPHLDRLTGNSDSLALHLTSRLALTQGLEIIPQSH